jgi:hypothetical protein
LLPRGARERSGRGGEPDERGVADHFRCAAELRQGKSLVSNPPPAADEEKAVMAMPERWKIPMKSW